jgi:predicted GTPase
VSQERDAADSIIAAINVMSTNLEMVGREVAKDHPTLVQGFMRVLVGYLEELAHQARKGYTDARNEASGQIARELVTYLREHDHVFERDGHLRAAVPFI